jgi:F-box protein 9
MEESNPELETFRRQWRAEVSARSKLDHSKTNSNIIKKAQPPKTLHRLSGQSRIPGEKSRITEIIDDQESESVPSFQAFGSPTSGKTSTNDDIEGYGGKTGSREPRSALEHYEQAVERESQGNLGDSLNLYRKAFKVGRQFLL